MFVNLGDLRSLPGSASLRHMSGPFCVQAHAAQGRCKGGELMLVRRHGWSAVLEALITPLLPRIVVLHHPNFLSKQPEIHQLSLPFCPTNLSASRCMPRSSNCATGAVDDGPARPRSGAAERSGAVKRAIHIHQVNLPFLWAQGRVYLNWTATWNRVCWTGEAGARQGRTISATVCGESDWPCGACSRAADWPALSHVSSSASTEQRLALKPRAVPEQRGAIVVHRSVAPVGRLKFSDEHAMAHTISYFAWRCKSILAGWEVKLWIKNGQGQLGPPKGCRFAFGIAHTAAYLP